MNHFQVGRRYAGFSDGAKTTITVVSRAAYTINVVLGGDLRTLQPFWDGVCEVVRPHEALTISAGRSVI